MRSNNIWSFFSFHSYLRSWRGKSLLLCCSLFLFAIGMQAQDPFNPDDPPEPSTPVFKYALSVSCSPRNAGVASGAGNYVIGTTVNITTSENADYTFSHWTLNGEFYSNQKNFTYTTVKGQMDFVAVYAYTPAPFDPADPSEPSMIVKSRLYLTSLPAGICTFNRTSGALVEIDKDITINVTNVNQGYEFEGWYQGETLLSETKSFTYHTGYDDATLVARFRELPPDPFDPDDPDEPNSQGGDIDNPLLGDVNRDTQITIADVTALVNIILGKDNVEPYQFDHKAANVNKDNTISISDVTALVNIILGKQ